jgi:hypothetical protein
MTQGRPGETLPLVPPGRRISHGVRCPARRTLGADREPAPALEHKFERDSSKASALTFVNMFE